MRHIRFRENMLSLCYETIKIDTMKVGDKVLISPDLTLQKKWLAGTVIQVENNPFVGIVISAETEDRNVFFGREDLFKLAKEEVCLP